MKKYLIALAYLVIIQIIANFSIPMALGILAFMISYNFTNK
jgi:ABC-type Fe3+ transport system permease subunit